MAHCPILGPWINYVPCWALWVIVKVQVGALPGRQVKEAACDEAGREDGVRPGCTERAGSTCLSFQPQWPAEASVSPVIVP